MSHSTLFEHDKPFLDAKGRARLDVRLDYRTGVVRVDVKMIHTQGRYRWVVYREFALDSIAFPTRAERRRTLSAYADMVAIKLGHEYQLRSKL